MSERITSEQELEDIVSLIRQSYAESNGDISVQVKMNAKHRTNLQKDCIWLYSELMAQALNEAGWDHKTFIDHIASQGVETPWTKDLFMDEVWRRFQGAYFPETILKSGKPSTSKLTREQVSKIYENINLRMAELSGISVPFPSKDR